MLTCPKELCLDIGLGIACDLVDLLDGAFLQIKQGQKQGLIRRQLFQGLSHDLLAVFPFEPSRGGI